jgi:nicotinate (nicotinamide) nucleotide adenylyltransferase
MKSKKNQSIETRVSEVFSIFGKQSTAIAIAIADVKKQLMKLDFDLTGKEKKLVLGQLFVAVVNLFNSEGISLQKAAKKGLAWIEENKHLYKANGRKKRIAIIPGSFDPFTYGHLEMGKVILNSGLVDKVVYMVANNHAEKKNQTPALKRLEMVRLALEGQRNMSVSSFEIDNELGGQTHFMTKKLLASSLFKDKEVSLVFGADVANSYTSWPDASLQTRLIRCIILARKGYTVRFSAWYNSPIHNVLDEADILGISSTQVRNAIAAKEDVSEMIHPAVEQYIIKNKLYKQKNKR